MTKFTSSGFPVFPFFLILLPPSPSELLEVIPLKPPWSTFTLATRLGFPLGAVILFWGA